MLSVRPKVAELVFQLFERPLHPELFEVYRTQTVSRGKYEAKIDITSCGHLVSLQYGKTTLTEVMTSALHSLPQQRRLLSKPLGGIYRKKIDCQSGIHYEADFQIEQVEPELIWTFQQELAMDGARQGLLHQFDSSGRMALGAVSFIHIENRDNSLFIQAFHTFPDDYAIVKSQSRFTID